MKISAFNRRLSELEANLYGRAVHDREVQDHLRQVTELLKGMEEFTESVARMSEDQKRQLAQQIDHDFRTMPLAPELEPYRDSFKRATLSNLGLCEICEEVLP